MYIGMVCLCYVFICLFLVLLIYLFSPENAGAMKLARVVSLPLAIAFVTLFVRCHSLSHEERKAVPWFHFRFRHS